MKFIEAIARMEGFGVHVNNVPTIPTRCNNPGDICAGQFAMAHGAIHGAPDPQHPDAGPCRYAVFPTEQAGWDALRALLTMHYSGMSVRQAVARYAPATENNTNEYVELVCRWTGMGPDAILTAEDIG